eukprot:151266-Pyramimonas_sp.AAC.1
MPSGSNIPMELFMSLDQNPRHIKDYTTVKFYVDRHAGVVSSQWKPLLRITPVPATELEYGSMRAFNFDRDAIEPTLQDAFWTSA